MPIKQSHSAFNLLPRCRQISFGSELRSELRRGDHRLATRVAIHTRGWWILCREYSIKGRLERHSRVWQYLQRMQQSEGRNPVLGDPLVIGRVIVGGANREDGNDLFLPAGPLSKPFNSFQVALILILIVT